MKIFEKVSEKILPQKIKKIVWHKTTDIIIINCGKYFEVQRISFKHETIFKREEKTEIFNISILDAKETIMVMLIDGSFTIININNGEILFASSLKKNLSEQSNFVLKKIVCNSNETYEKFAKNNPFNSNNHLVFNSFSKIDVSKVNFYNNETFSFDSFILLNKKSNEMDLYQKMVSNFGKCKIKEGNTILNIFNFETKNALLYANKINKNDYDFWLLSLSQSISYNDNVTSYHLQFAQYMLDYISQILDLIKKIVSKLGYILFDKYSDANELSYKITIDNETEYHRHFNEELKKLFLFGNISESLMNFLKNDLFESRSIIKMDENIHFNLKNVQDILIENVKPALNQLGYFFNEIKFYKKDIIQQKNLEILHEGFSDLYLSFDELIESLLEVNYDYRNFLAWINSFNTKENNPNNNNSNTKNYLSNICFDYEHVFKFISSYHYNMEHILSRIDGEYKEDNTIPNDNKENINMNSTLFSDSKNSLLRKYINDNAISIDTVSRENQKSKKEKKSLKHYLSFIKSTLNSISSNLNDSFTSSLSSLPSKLFTIKNIQSDINDLSLTTNETLDSIFTFTNNDLLKTVLYVMVFNSKTSQFKFAKINFTYENEVIIIDYKVTRQNELVLLVKSNKVDESKVLTTKYSIILTSLLNYSYVSLDNKDNVNTFDFFNFNSIEDIKIDSFADVECSDQSFISLGERRLIALVDNVSNKITIIDIISS